MKKVKLSADFDVLPENEVGIRNAVDEFLKINFRVNRIGWHRKEIVFNKGGEKT